MGCFKRITLIVLFLGLITFCGCQDMVPQNPKSLLVPRFQRSEIFGFVAGLGTTFAAVRRSYFEKQLQETKENLIKAEQSMQAVQEKSGVVVLDKQAEALISGAATVRAQITEREVQLKVLRTSATEQNPMVMRLNSELRALRSELARMESAQGGVPGKRRRHADRQAPGSGGRLRSRPTRAEAAGDATRGDGAPVRDCQTRRGQGRPCLAAGRHRPATGLQVEAAAPPDRHGRCAAGDAADVTLGRPAPLLRGRARQGPGSGGLLAQQAWLAHGASGADESVALECDPAQRFERAATTRSPVTDRLRRGCR